MKFKTTEWTLALHFAAAKLEACQHKKHAAHCRNMLAWILRNICDLEAIPGKEPKSTEPLSALEEAMTEDRGKDHT